MMGKEEATVRGFREWMDLGGVKLKNYSFENTNIPKSSSVYILAKLLKLIER